MGDLCTKAGERETRQKNVSLPPKVGELASLSVCNIFSLHVLFLIFSNIFNLQVRFLVCSNIFNLHV